MISFQWVHGKVQVAYLLVSPAHFLNLANFSRNHAHYKQSKLLWAGGDKSMKTQQRDQTFLRRSGEKLVQGVGRLPRKPGQSPSKFACVCMKCNWCLAYRLASRSTMCFKAHACIYVHTAVVGSLYWNYYKCMFFLGQSNVPRQTWSAFSFCVHYAPLCKRFTSALYMWAIILLMFCVLFVWEIAFHKGSLFAATPLNPFTSLLFFAKFLNSCGMHCSDLITWLW